MGYELFENHGISVTHLASPDHVILEPTVDFGCYSIGWRHQKPRDLPATGTQVYQIETESEPWMRVSDKVFVR